MSGNRNRGVLGCNLLAAVTLLVAGSAANGMYDPKHGRWLQRDPAGMKPTRRGRVDLQRQHMDGMNSYQYIRSCPAGYVDWIGEQTSKPSPPTTQPPTSCPYSQPSQPATRAAADYDRLVKTDVYGHNYIPWNETATSPWQRIAEGTLDACPSTITFPLAVEAALAKAMRLTMRTEREHAGSITYARETKVDHRIWGPKEGTRNVSSSGGTVGDPWLWTQYGLYHTHVFTPRNQIFSEDDVANFLRGYYRGKEGENIYIMRTCPCTRALVRTRTTTPREKMQRASIPYNDTIRSDDPCVAAQEAEAIDRQLATLSGAHHFCFYKACGPNQSTLGLQVPGGQE